MHGKCHVTNYASGASDGDETAVVVVDVGGDADSGQGRRQH